MNINHTHVIYILLIGCKFIKTNKLSIFCFTFLSTAFFLHSLSKHKAYRFFNTSAFALSCICFISIRQGCRIFSSALFVLISISFFICFVILIFENYIWKNKKKEFNGG